VFALAASAAVSAAPPTARAQETRPNVLIIVTDDQRANGTLKVMPNTVKYFEKGVEFENAYATTPLCCPSRASIFTGQYMHNHQVRNNGRGEVKSLEQTTTLQYYLQQAGYRTGITGKYLNGWDVWRRPPFFDEYAITKRGYYGARFGIGRDGDHRVAEIPWYSTNFIARKAVDFLSRAETQDDTPWLLYVAPFAPHHPARPPLRYEGDPVANFRPDPAMLEVDLSDKPPQYASSASAYDEQRMELRRRRQLRSLMAVDDLVTEVTETLESTGEENTLVFFMSDNGYLWGEHRLDKKGVPYQPSVRIPLMIRWDGRVSPATDMRLAANIDIAPTVFDAADVEPGHEVDGKTLLEAWERDELLTEVKADRSRPGLHWASLVSHDYQYVEYYGEDENVPVFREYYSFVTDPWQLNNVLGDEDPSNDPDTTSHSSRLAAYRSCPLLTPCP